MTRCKAIRKFFAGIEYWLLHMFYLYGSLLGGNPVPFIIVPVIILSSFSVGLLNVETATDLELLYAPRISRSLDERAEVEAVFPDSSKDNYNPLGVTRDMPEVMAIFQSKKPNEILKTEAMTEIAIFMQHVNEDLKIEDNGKTYTYQDLCAKDFHGRCFIYGAVIYTPEFLQALENEQLTWPYTQLDISPEPIDLTVFLAEVETTPQKILIGATYLKLNFQLRGDTSECRRLALIWENEYIKFMKKNNTYEYSTVVFTTSKSLDLELEETVQKDVIFFILTFICLLLFSTIASTGGDCVSTRALLASCGVLTTALGVFGGFGLAALSGVKYVSMVSIMPFLTIGIGVNDMFLLMSAWSETLSITDISVQQRIALVYKKAGIGITITSLTDFLAFCMGYTSLFVSVQNFCVYSGAGVILCYFANATIFGACLTLHGRRVYDRRHAFTCQTVPKSRDEILSEGGGTCRAFVCGGQIPLQAEHEQSLCERGPHAKLTKFLVKTPVQLLIFALFATYLGVAIWGCTRLKQGLNVKDLVLDDSYFMKFQVEDEKMFGLKIPISFVRIGKTDYSSPEALGHWKELLSEAKKDPLINDNVESCWLTTLAGTQYYSTTSQEDFISGVIQFLSHDLNAGYRNDVIFDDKNQSIIASRCHVISVNLIDSNDQGEAMKRTRAIADNSPTGAFAFCRGFVIFEQFLTILPSTLKTVGQTVAVMFVVTLIFLPHPLIVLLVMAQVVSILIGVFGFMAHANLNLSAITMIHLIMSVGFSVDFCAHVCTAFMVSEAPTRKGRALYAVVHASGPILNGGFSSMIGVFVLLFSKSYIFKSFFIIMMLVLSFGMAHAILLIPVILSLIGPDAHIASVDEGLPEIDNQDEDIHTTTNGPKNETESQNGKESQRPTDLGRQVLSIISSPGTPIDSQLVSQAVSQAASQPPSVR